MGKNMAWLIPRVTKGSGGHRTIIQNINLLIKERYSCDIYVKDDVDYDAKTIKNQINEYFMECSANVFKGFESEKEYDVVFATSWETYEFAKKIKAKKLIYFVQDFEPWFFPMGDNYLLAEDTYEKNVSAITIGKWLSYKLNKEYDMNTNYFDFCADLNIYKKEKIKKENAICAIYQPEKSRRCAGLLLNSLKIVKKINPDIKIYLFGSNIKSKDLDCINLGIISPKELNKLYNKCKLGISISSSNPSRIPYEMMASRLPVIDLYRENNLYDFDDNCILLAKSNSKVLATAILELYSNEKKLNEMSKNSLKFMKKYPLEYGYSEFINCFNNLINSKEKIKINKTYNKKAYDKILPEILSIKINNSINFNDDIKNYYEYEIEKLNNIILKYDNDLNNIVNSKRFKFLTKLSNIFKK